MYVSSDGGGVDDVTREFQSVTVLRPEDSELVVNDTFPNVRHVFNGRTLTVGTKQVNKPHNIDTSELVVGYGANNMVAVQSGMRTSNLSVTNSTRSPTTYTLPVLQKPQKMSFKEILQY
jgi:hypothetical protein